MRQVRGWRAPKSLFDTDATALWLPPVEHSIGLREKRKAGVFTELAELQKEG